MINKGRGFNTFALVSRFVSFLTQISSVSQSTVSNKPAQAGLPSRGAGDEGQTFRQVSERDSGQAL